MTFEPPAPLAEAPVPAPRPARRRMPVGTIVALVMILTGVLCAVVINVKRHQAAHELANAKPKTLADLPKLGFGPVGDFSLTESSGKTVTIADLRGHVWVAETFFSYCGAICPRMNTNLRKIQFEFDENDEPKIVSVSVDPGRDKPSALQEHARMLHADPSRWWFLTGDPQEITKLTKSLMLPYDPLVPSNHLPTFILVDREGWIRGKYNGTDAADMDLLREDLRLLLPPSTKKN